MAIFNDSSEYYERLDWRILQNGWTYMYWRQSILEEDIKWFEKEGYQIFDFDCKDWKNTDIMHHQLMKRLSFPGYYGHNLDALNDCLSDLEINDSGTVFIFRHFDRIDKDLG